MAMLFGNNDKNYCNQLGINVLSWKSEDIISKYNNYGI